jgi:hypothetical protein
VAEVPETALLDRCAAALDCRGLRPVSPSSDLAESSCEHSMISRSDAVISALYDTVGSDSLHPINLSARSTKARGDFKGNRFCALQIDDSSNPLRCSTGISPGLAPDRSLNADSRRLKIFLLSERTERYATFGGTPGALRASL